MREHPDPLAGMGELLVRVRAAGLDHEERGQRAHTDRTKADGPRRPTVARSLDQRVDEAGETDRQQRAPGDVEPRAQLPIVA